MCGGGDARPTPFTTFTITYKVAVYSTLQPPGEWADTDRKKANHFLQCTLLTPAPPPPQEGHSEKFSNTKEHIYIGRDEIGGVYLPTQLEAEAYTATKM